MQIIKIPFSIKFYFFFALIWIIISLLGIDYWYWYYWLNYLLTGTISLLLSIIQVVLIFKYFKDPKKYSNINIIFIIILLLIYIWLALYKSFYMFIIILYHLVFLINFIQYKKFINLEQWEKKDKYIKYTNKNQYKNILILYWLLILSLIVFYFAQYSKVINFKHIDDSYFNVSEHYLDYSKETNWDVAFKKYLEHLHKLDFVEDRNFRDKDYMQKVLLDDSITFKFDINRIKEIDNLRLWIDEIINKKVIMYNIGDDLPLLQGLSMMTRESLYNVLYYLENWKEEKAIKYLIDNYKLSKLIISSYSTLANFIVWLTINAITLNDLEFIMNNYKLKNTTLDYIKNNLENSLNIKSSFKTTMNSEYYHSIFSDKNFKLKFLNNSIFSTKDYYKEWIKNVYYWFSQMYNDMKLDSDWYYNTNTLNSNSFDSLDEYICSKKNIDKLRWNLILPKLFFRKNTISNLSLVNTCLRNRSYKPDLENAIIKENKILERINKILENKSNNWKTLLKK